jgi:integrase
MLSDRRIRAAKPLGRPYKLFDARGLYLYVSPQGSRLWRLKYRWAGREKTLSFGPYPEITLADARDRQVEARKLLREGRDPASEARARRGRQGVSPDRFETLAREWHGRQKERWSPGHARDVLTLLERLVFPAIGAMPINDITPPMALACLRRIEATGAIDTAHRARQMMSATFVYAIACGLGQNDPAAIVKSALQHAKHRRQPALIELAEVQAVLRAVEASSAGPGTKAALRLLALTGCRAGEARGARWDEFEALDGAEPIWRIPAARMKTGSEHVIPLPGAAVAVVESMRPLSGSSVFVFPHARSDDRPLTRQALLALLHRCGYRGRMSVHGFRSAFSSIMNERHPDAHDAIEAQLAHVVRGVRGAYLRAPFLERRRQLLAEWADLLLEGAMDAPALLLGSRR